MNTWSVRLAHAGSQQRPRTENRVEARDAIASNRSLKDAMHQLLSRLLSVLLPAHHHLECLQFRATGEKRQPPSTKALHTKTPVSSGNQTKVFNRAIVTHNSV